MTIQEIRNDLIELGLSDNIDLAVLLYLAVSVRRTLHKISILVTGPAGAGKSFLAKSIMDLLPSEDVLAISKMTPAALVRCGDLSSKVLYVYEKFKDVQFAQYIRELISEGEVRYTTVNEDYLLKGPTTLIETTANPDIVGIENKSRCFVVDINTSEKARRNILERQKTLRTTEGFRNGEIAGKIQQRHREFQKGLETSTVVLIPFARRIAFYSFCQHSSRILERVLNVITAIAFLEQSNRKQIEGESGHRYIEATEEDFNIAKGMLQRLSSDESEMVLPEDTFEFMEILRCHREELNKCGSFTRGHVFDIISKSHYPHKSTKVVIKHLSMLSQIGLIDERLTRGVKNRREYTLSRAFPAQSSQGVSRNSYGTLCLI